MITSRNRSTVTLDAHIRMRKGYAFKSQWYRDQGRPIVKVSNFTDDSVDSTDLLCITDEIADQYLRYELKTGDIVIQTVGSWPNNPQSVVGKVIRIPRSVSGALLNQNAVIIDPAPDLDKSFLFYLLRSDHFKRYIIGTAQGAANQASITLDSIKGFSFVLPQLTTQRKIAAILSAYDDLIENNTRRIKILEEMAQMIYREWFVHFRFPGHEKVRMVDSPLGKIPEKWEVSKIEDLYNTASGGTPSRKIDEYFNGSINWIKTQELQDGFVFETDEKITETGLQNSSAKVFPVNSIIIAMYGATIGKLGILAQPASTNQACCALLQKDKEFGHTYGFLTLLERRKDIIGLRMGAAQQNISQVVIKNFQILNPNEQILEYFNDIVNPMFDLIRDLQRKNQILRRTRDLLLPKLISGEVEVEDIEVRVSSGEMG